LGGTSPKDVESYGASILLTMVDIVDLEIPSTSVDTGQQFHPHMECDDPTLTIWVVDSLSSHDFLYIEFPSEEAILDVMDSIDKPKEDDNHHTFLLHYLEP